MSAKARPSIELGGKTIPLDAPFELDTIKKIGDALDRLAAARTLTEQLDASADMVSIATGKTMNGKMRLTAKELVDAARAIADSARYEATPKKATPAASKA